MKASDQATQPKFSMAPPMSGQNTWSYLRWGNGNPKRSPKNVSPCAVTSNSSSASRSRNRASDWRASRPRSNPSRSERSSWNGPAAMTGTYVDSGGVSGNSHRRPRGSRVTTGSPLLLTTRQRSGASTVKRCGRLEVGLVEAGPRARASSGSNEVQT
jgi:hypothetical protein